MFRLFFSNVHKRLLAPYRGYFWAWHIAAALATAALVVTGIDWWFFESTRNEAFLWLVAISGAGGFFVPLIVPIVLYVRGTRRKDTDTVRTAVGVAQASIVAWIIIAIYKAFTGRIQPDYLADQGLMHISNGFQFGFWEHGIFWGWPSHHTAVAVAGATVVYLAWRHSKLRFAALAWAVIVGAGAAVGFHWFSDVIAGAIVGTAVGIAVWRDIKKA